MQMKKEMIDTQEKKEDRNPEKRKREAHMRFEEERMVELKQEYPTLKMSQLKEKIWKEVIETRFVNFLQWVKSPLNPMN